MSQNQNKTFYNTNLPDELNKILAVMLGANIAYKDELIEQLNNIKVKKIDKEIGFMAYVFDIVNNEKLSYKNIKSPAIDMLVYPENEATTEFLLFWSEEAKELQILNIHGEEYLELWDFSDIEFI